MMGPERKQSLKRSSGNNHALKEDWRHIIHTLPSSPGIYRYYNEGGGLLYVGKAKNIKKRVSSYFSHKAVNRKTAELVSRIHTIQFTIVHSEADALLLENTLIKQYKPLFNIKFQSVKSCGMGGVRVGGWIFNNKWGNIFIKWFLHHRFFC